MRPPAPILSGGTPASSPGQKNPAETWQSTDSQQEFILGGLVHLQVYHSNALFRAGLSPDPQQKQVIVYCFSSLTGSAALSVNAVFSALDPQAALAAPPAQQPDFFPVEETLVAVAVFEQELTSAGDTLTNLPLSAAYSTAV
jgi:hypothetical protein